MHGNGRSVQDRLIEAAEESLLPTGIQRHKRSRYRRRGRLQLASVNYYFGGKDSLYLEIWRRRLASMRQTRLASIEKVMSAGDHPRLEDLLEVLRDLVMERLNNGEAARADLSTSWRGR